MKKIALLLFLGLVGSVYASEKPEGEEGQKAERVLSGLDAAHTAAGGPQRSEASRALMRSFLAFMESNPTLTPGADGMVTIAIPTSGTDGAGRTVSTTFVMSLSLEQAAMIRAFMSADQG